MSSWTGWNEQQLRGPSSTPGGFTPINATPAQPPDVPSAHEEEPARQAKTSNVITLQAVAEYLGRGEKPATSIDPHAKNSTAKHRKRASPTAKGHTTKRRQFSNTISDSMSITKLGESDPQACIYRQSGTSTMRQSSDKSKKHSGTKASGGHSVSTNVGGDAPNMTIPVSVYAHSTSMDALDSTSARTSCDSVKAGSGRGYTLYQSQSPMIRSNDIVEFSQPWLNTASTVQAISTERDEPVVEVTTVDIAFPTKRPSRQAKTMASEKNSNLFRRHEHEILSEAECPPQHANATSAQMRSKTTAHNEETDCSIQTVGSSSVADDSYCQEEDFSDVDEEAMVDAVMAVEEIVGPRPETPPPRHRKQNMREVDEDEDYGGALLSTADRLLLSKFKEDARDAVKPVVRKPFQQAILDRSPIFGASSGTLLRTCFRLGEALNTGSQAVRCNQNCIIELYARVTSSWREERPGRKQHFIFNDLYHDKPPLLDGTFELWDQSQLWDLDSKVFLTAGSAGIKCRVIAKMKRDGQKWRLEILSIWEATWEDVDYAAGIYTDDVKADDD